MYKVCKAFMAVIIAAVVIFTAQFAQAEADVPDISLLEALNIVTDGGNTDKPISRTEFLKLSLKLIGSYDIAQSYEAKSIFRDISQDNVNAPIISFAYDRSYVIGYNGLFEPDSAITLGEAETILLRVTGYSVIAETKGDRYAVNAMKMEKGIQKSTADKITYAEAYRMILNILDAAYYDVVAYGNEIKFSNDDNATVLSHFHDVYSKIDILNAAKTVALSDSDYNSRYAKVGDEEFICDLDYAEKYVGYSVKCYYRSSSDEKEIIAIYPDKNDVLEIDADRLAKDAGDFGVQKIVYYNEKEKRVSARVNVYADMIYNGEAYPDFDKNTLLISNGKIKLIDNNTDGSYDVIVVDEYHNILVDNVNTDERVVFGRNNTTVKLDRSRGQDVKIYGSDGSYYEFGDIAYGDVLTVYASKSGMKVVAYDTTTKIFDAITEISNNGDIIVVTAGGREYEVDREFAASREYAENPITTKTRTGLYLDMYGRIAGIGEQAAGFNNYAYIFAAAKNMAGFETEYALKLFTKNGSFEVFTLKDKLTCLDAVMTNEEVYNEIIRRGTYGAIKIEANDKNEISRLDFPVDNTANKKYLPDVFSHDASTTGGQEGEYRTGIFGSSYLISRDTVVFGVPDMTKPANRLEKNFKLMSIDSFSENVWYVIDVYDLDPVYCAGLIITRPIEGAVSFEKMNDEILLVDNVAEAIDEEEEIYNVIEGWHRGSYVRWNLSNNENDVVHRDLRKGDVLRVYRDSSGTIIYTVRIIRLGKDTVFSEGAYDGNYSGARGYMEYGKVGAVKNGSLAVTTDGGKTIRPHKITAAYVYLYDTKTGKITKSDAGNIYSENTLNGFDGDSIFLNIKWNRVKDIVIVR